MEIKSILIKDTTREERIRIVQEGLNQCGGACDFCNGCDNLGGGSMDAFYEPSSSPNFLSFNIIQIISLLS